jgi:hypothetical protein
MNMTAKPGHVRVRESSMGISRIGGKLDTVDVACMGLEGSEMEGTESTSSECGCSGKEEKLSGASVMVDCLGMVS